LRWRFVPSRLLKRDIGGYGGPSLRTKTGGRLRVPYVVS
jgi:hypothetical protein